MSCEDNVLSDEEEAQFVEAVRLIAEMIGRFYECPEDHACDVCVDNAVRLKRIAGIS